MSSPAAAPSESTGAARPLVAVSACLLGHAVRYDGSAKPSRPVLELLRHLFDLIPVCPERAIGLGVPRPPIQLVESPSGLRVVEVAEARHDYTGALRSFAVQFLRQWPGVCGLIVKARSPSCALVDAPVAPGTGRTAPGMFVQSAMVERPGLPMVDERGLDSQVVLLQFLVQVLRCYRGAVAPQSVPGTLRAGGSVSTGGSRPSARALAEMLREEIALPESGLSALGVARIRGWLQAHGFSAGRL